MIQDKIDTLVFVYGSLKKGFSNHRLLAESEYLGPHITDGKYTLISLGAFPAVLNHGGTQIHGELYAVDEGTFKRLDGLEGYPSFYNRIQIKTPTGKAWMYVLNRDMSNSRYGIVSDGVWRHS